MNPTTRSPSRREPSGEPARRQTDDPDTTDHQQIDTEPSTEVDGVHDAHDLPLVVERRSPWRFRGRRTPAPRAHFLFRWIFPLVIAGLAVATVLLGIHAKDLVLNSRDGDIVENVTDPAAPGFTAEVVPTPTLLVIQTTDKGELVNVAIMSIASSGGGGTAVFFPSEMLVVQPNGDSTSLAKLFADAGLEGEAALRRQLTRMINADIDSSIVLGSKTLAELIKPVAPLRYNLVDSVRTVQNGVNVTVLKSGPVSIATLEQVQAANELLSPGEASVNRTARQIAFWEAWFKAVRAAPDPASVLPPFASGLPMFANALSTGTTPAQLRSVPFTEFNYRGLVLQAVDVEALRQITARMIPYPKSYQPGARLLVEVRNGVGDLTRNEPMNRLITAANGEIVLLGNAPAFGVANTSVVFYDEANRSRVEDFAREIGVASASIRFVERPGSSIEVTVTIGADFTP